MKKLKVVLIIFLLIFLLAGIGLAVFNFYVPKSSALLIETSPASTVYIDGEEVGRTPYTSIRKPKEILLRLVPDTFGRPLAPFEGKVNLNSGVETVVRRYFGTSDIYTEGEILSFEKLPARDTIGINVTTDPSNAQIEIDSVSKGTSPFTSSSIDKGVHTIKISLSGYKDRSIEVDLEDGFKLIADIKLSKIETPEEVLEEKPTEISQSMVRILTTPTGFLRVRQEATTSAKEIAQVKPGDEYLLIEKDTTGTWYRISIKEGLEGWVTSQYAEVFEG